MRHVNANLKTLQTKTIIIYKFEGITNKDTNLTHKKIKKKRDMLI